MIMKQIENNTPEENYRLYNLSKEARNVFRKRVNLCNCSEFERPSIMDRVSSKSCYSRSTFGSARKPNMSKSHLGSKYSRKNRPSVMQGSQADMDEYVVSIIYQEYLWVDMGGWALQ